MVNDRRLMRRREPAPRDVPFLPVLLVVLGVLALVSGVALPVRLLAAGPAALTSGRLSLFAPPVLVGIALVVSGTAALVLGMLLLTFERGFR